MTYAERRAQWPSQSPGYRRAKRAADPEKFRAYERTRDRRADLRAANLRRRFSLTVEQYDALFQSQDGLCAICHQPEHREGYALAVDHDHDTGRVRGLLCAQCNQGLGRLGDDVARLQAAIAYLEREAP